MLEGRDVLQEVQTGAARPRHQERDSMLGKPAALGHGQVEKKREIS